MSEEQGPEKIKVPEDFPGEGTGPGDVQEPAPVEEKDPEVLAEQKKNKIWHLKMERYKDIANSVAELLKTFRAEVVSLMSGAGSVVVGWFQIKKLILRGRAETKVEAHGLGIRGTGPRSETGGGNGYGSGSGRLGAGHRHEHAKFETKTVEGIPVKKEVASSTMVESVAPAMAATVMDGSSLMADPMNYVMIGLPVVFVWSSAVAWFKRKKKMAEKQGGK